MKEMCMKRILTYKNNCRLDINLSIDNFTEWEYDDVNNVVD